MSVVVIKNSLLSSTSLRSSTLSVMPKSFGTKDLSQAQRAAILRSLLHHSCEGKLPYGIIKDVAIQFEAHRDTVGRLWKSATIAPDALSVSSEIASKKTRRCGRRKEDREVIQVAIRAAPLRERTNYHWAEVATGIAKSTLHRVVKEGFLKTEKESLKPILTTENKVARLRFWFGIQRHVWPCLGGWEVVLYEDTIEEKPTRTIRNRRYMPKVMFYTAVARPRYDASGNALLMAKWACGPLLRGYLRNGLQRIVLQGRWKWRTRM